MTSTMKAEEENSTTPPINSAADDLKQYQVSDEFPPNKEPEWNFPPQQDGWVHAHNAIRGELRTIQECFETIQKLATTRAGNNDPSASLLKEWQISAIQTVFDAHYKFVHSHHTNEDEIMAPAIAKRVKYPDKLTTDHDGIVKALTDLKTTIDTQLKVGDDIDETMSLLLKQWQPYRKDLEEHLTEEEDIGLPLLRAFFTPKESHDQIVSKILAKETKLEMGCFVYYMGEERMRREFMKQHGIPFFVWYVAFKGAHQLYQTEIVAQVQALKSGVVEPIPIKRKGLLGC